MCENKEKCSCGCKTKLTESKQPEISKNIVDKQKIAKFFESTRFDSIVLRMKDGHKQRLTKEDFIKGIEPIYENIKAIETHGVRRFNICENLDLNLKTKRELIREAKTALDAMYAIYDLCEQNNIQKDKFLGFVDESFNRINQLVTVLVSQDIAKPKK